MKKKEKWYQQYRHVVLKKEGNKIKKIIYRTAEPNIDNVIESEKFWIECFKRNEIVLEKLTKLVDFFYKRALY